MPTSKIVANPTDREAVKEMPTSKGHTNEKPTSKLVATNREAVAKLIKKTTAAKSMQLQIRKHGTTLYHQEQAARLGGGDGDDDDR